MKASSLAVLALTVVGASEVHAFDPVDRARQACAILGMRFSDDFRVSSVELETLVQAEGTSLLITSDSKIAMARASVKSSQGVDMSRGDLEARTLDLARRLGWNFRDAKPVLRDQKSDGFAVISLVREPFGYPAAVGGGEFLLDSVSGAVRSARLSWSWTFAQPSIGLGAADALAIARREMGGGELFCSEPRFVKTLPGRVEERAELAYSVSRRGSSLNIASSDGVILWRGQAQTARDASSLDSGGVKKAAPLPFIMILVAAAGVTVGLVLLRLHRASS